MDISPFHLGVKTPAQYTALLRKLLLALALPVKKFYIKMAAVRIIA
jgi:hypothetical protein